STGDALRIASAHGAAHAQLDAYQGHAALAMPSATLVGWATVMHGGIVVGRSGQRFSDETAGYSEFASEMLAHADGEAWIVIDRAIHEECLVFRDCQDTVDSGALRWASSTDELAGLVGVDPTGLSETVRSVRAIARGEATDPYGRTHWERELGEDL